MVCCTILGGSHVRFPNVGRVRTRSTRAVAAPMHVLMTIIIHVPGCFEWISPRPTSIVLNSAARLISGVPKFDSVSAAIRNELHRLPIQKHIRFKIALLVRHCIVGAAPEYLTELCRPVSSSSGRQCLRSASRGDLIVPRFRLRRSGYRAFAVSGPHAWNSLPTGIRQS